MLPGVVEQGAQHLELASLKLGHAVEVPAKRAACDRPGGANERTTNEVTHAYALTLVRGRRRGRRVADVARRGRCLGARDRGELLTHSLQDLVDVVLHEPRYYRFGRRSALLTTVPFGREWRALG
jgi:hypothetical protein